MSDAEIKRRKKLQGRITETTSTLGLASLGTYAVASRAKGGKSAYRTLKKLPAMQHHTPGTMHDSLKDKSLATGIVGSGIAGVGGFNNAAILNAESRKRKQGMSTVKKNDDGLSPTFGDEGISKRYQEEIAKIGEWKTIDQRELSQRRSRKAMRYAGAGAATGAGLLAAGHPRGTKALKRVAEVTRVGLKHPEVSTKKAVVRGAKEGKRYVKADPTGAGASAAGLGLVAGSTAIGGAAKGQHTYQQHKINDRRRANYKREQLGKAWTPSSSKFDPEGQRMKRSDAYPKMLAGVSGTAAAGAGYKGLQAVKAGALAHQRSKQLKKPSSSSKVRNLKLAQKNALKGGGKLVAVSAATGGAAVLAHRKKHSEGWQPYVSKSAFGVSHED